MDKENIINGGAISVATYDLVDNRIAKTLKKKILSNVATITCDRAHGKTAGEIVYITGLTTHLEYNGYFLITAVPTVESFSYALTHADDAENADASGVVDNTILKTVEAQVYFMDYEECRKIYKTGTTATGIIIGYGR